MSNFPFEIRVIPLGPITKYHFEMPGIPAMHRITADPDGMPHDHPFAMTSIVSYGGYTEEVFRPDGTTYLVDHRRNDNFPEDHCMPVSQAFLISAKHIHRIIATENDEPCYTITWPHKWEQHAGIWRWVDGVAEKQIFGQEEWIRHDLGNL